MSHTLKKSVTSLYFVTLNPIGEWDATVVYDQTDGDWGEVIMYYFVNARNATQAIHMGELLAKEKGVC